MQITPEIKAQLEEQKKHCVFCKIISGEIPGKNVFEDNDAIAFLDINPAVKGHVLFMLKEHYPMPAYIPGDEFKHKFSLIPSLSKAIKSATIKTGMDVFIAVGGVAGQQVGHFAVHLMPREVGDGFFNFLFNKFPGKIKKKEVDMLSNNLSIMMKNHFGRHPANWHVGKGDVIPNFLSKIYENNDVIYEDEKVLCVIPENSLTKGHLIIYSKTEEKYIEKLSNEESAHLFFTASFASTAVFEGLGAHATNILLKSGESDDNPKGLLEVHVLPRWQDDHLKQINWQPKPASYDLDSVAKKIKDKADNINSMDYSKEKVKNKIITPEVIKIKASSDKKEIKKRNVDDEIKRAIDSVRNK